MSNSAWKDDEELLEEFRNKNPKAFRHIYDLYYPRMCFYAKKHLHDLPEQEDIVAEAFVKLWERSHNFTKLDHIRAFLFRVILNSCIDFLRNRNNNRQGELYKLLAEYDEAYAKAAGIETELFNKMMAEVENLPKGMKQVFLMALEGKSTAEIAKKLKISEDTVRGQRAKAVKSLRNIFGDKGLSPDSLLTLAIFTLLTKILHL